MDTISWNMWNITIATYETLHMKHYKVTHETSHMQHGHAINETWVALMKHYLMIMLYDAHDQVLTTF